VAEDAPILVADLLQPAHFYLDSHKLIYEAIIAIYRKGDTPDMRFIHDHGDYNDDEGSRDRMQYEAGYYDGLDGLSSKLEYMKLVRRPTKSKREVA